MKGRIGVAIYRGRWDEYMANDGGNKGRNNMCVLVAGATQEHLWRGGSASLPQGDAHRALIRPAAAHVVTGG